jgi:hypothetical protein
MFDDSSQIARESEQDLDAWICAWYDAAVLRGFIRSPYDPDAATIRRIHGYFHLDLSPAEAAEACFARKH